jgi:XamI restriction endonuclease
LSSQADKDFHTAQAKIAAELYLKTRKPDTFAAAWHLALREARSQITDALKASNMLLDVEQALDAKGAHMIVYRRLMAPPISQDQFKILCPAWNKTSEDEGGKLKPEAAKATAAIFHAWRHKQLTMWVDKKAKPTPAEMRELLTAIAPLIATQVFGTALRNQQSQEQENAVTKLLDSIGWKRLPSKLIDRRASLEPKHYMYKTRFATGQGSPYEVDVACGLKDTYVLAMECKVTNDETNSKKRISDVLNKAAAWKAHWGNFVQAAALLQGVIAARDVHRLLNADVHVFWSHDLQAFEKWLTKRA